MSPWNTGTSQSVCLDLFEATLCEMHENFLLLGLMRSGKKAEDEMGEGTNARLTLLAIRWETSLS